MNDQRLVELWQIVWGNLFGRIFVVALVSFLAASVVKFALRLVSIRLRAFTKTTQSEWDDIGVDLLDGLRTWVLFIWIIYALSHADDLPANFSKGLLFLAVVGTTYQLGLWGLHLIKNWHRKVLDKRIESDPSSAAALGLMATLVQLLFLAILVLIALSNLGIDVTALLAGLGVGGIAIALAAQNVLGDLLASLSIVFDKPFIVGDFIVSGSQSGTVEQIGIKTTRLRALSGEQLVIANKDLLESRVQNFKRMWQRRVVQQFGIVYSTPAPVVARIPDWVKAIVEAKENVKFDRCHFKGFGASSLDFEFVFFVSSPEYNVFMDLQQKILLELLEKFTTEKVEFAFPTQTVYLANAPEEPGGGLTVTEPIRQ